MEKRIKLPRVFTKDPKKVAAKRSCGSCTACCTCKTLEVPDCKPLEAVCAHLRKGRRGRRSGCAIYENRPEHCRDYACYWRLGVLTKNERPDKLGLILDTAAPNMDQVIAAAGVPVVLARETYPGSSRRIRAKAAVLSLIQKFAVIYVGIPGGSSVRAATPELTDKVIEAVREHAM